MRGSIQVFYNYVSLDSLMIDGVKVQDSKKNLDERGYFAELIRDDWKDFLGDDHLLGLSLSYSFPGIIRAWHKHLEGQNDYIVCLSGCMKICVFDDRKDSPTFGELDEIVLNGRERLQVARIVGSCWHGYKILSAEPALVFYGVSKLYNYDQPDEKRRPWEDTSLIPRSINGKKDDPRVGKPYDWNYPPHK
jgi:dTDP-4-dehydrorhamnose 3,5-epimerase